MTPPTSKRQHSGLDSFFSAARGIGIRRRTDTKWVGGVCSGIAERLRIDPVVVRAGLILLILLGGFGVAAYLVAWALLPDQQDRIAAERALRDGDAGSVVLLVVAAIALLGGFPWWFGGHGGAWGFPWGLVVLGAVVWVVVHRSRNGRTAVHPPSQPGPPAPGSPVGPAGEPQQQPSSDQAAAWGEHVGQRAEAWGQQLGSQVPVRRRERRRSGGLLMTLVGVGLAMVTYGGTLWLGDSLGFRGDHHVIALAGALAALGLLVLGLGVAGWRAGFLGVVAVCTAVATLAAGVAPGGLRMNGRMGDATWVPTSMQSSTSYDIGAGDGTLDLRRLPVDGLTNPTITARVGLGDLEVLMPAGLTVQFRGHVGLGEITMPDPAAPGGQDVPHDGPDVSHDALVGTGPADVTVDANVGVGDITVVKE
jgi:phage shock protein PspC (stress-responsive transcriptional regulator)